MFASSKRRGVFFFPNGRHNAGGGGGGGGGAMMEVMRVCERVKGGDTQTSPLVGSVRRRDQSCHLLTVRCVLMTK